MDRCIAGPLRLDRRVLAAGAVVQIKLRDLASAARDAGTPLPARYHRLFRVWFILGWPAFAGVVAILALMIAKPTF
jgi:uncharacterized membrane protein